MKDIIIEGFSLVVQEGVAGTIKISAVQFESFDFFESDYVTFVRINASTIFMAFKKESPFVNYRLKKAQYDLQIEFMITLDLLPPFSESIALQKVNGQKARSKIINKQIQSDVAELETLLQKFEISDHRVQLKDYSASDDKDAIWADDFSPGRYLVEISGSLGVVYHQGYEQVENIQDITTAPFELSIEEACLVTKVEKINLFYGVHQTYTPFSFSCFLHFKQEGKAYIKLKNVSIFINKGYCTNVISSVSIIF